MMNPDTPEFDLTPSPRPSETVEVRIPVDVLEALRKEAESRDMPLHALLRLYVGTGLRQDLAKRFSERLLDTTARVLSQHLSSDSEVQSILREIRSQASPTTHAEPRSGPA